MIVLKRNNYSSARALRKLGLKTRAVAGDLVHSIIERSPRAPISTTATAAMPFGTVVGPVTSKYEAKLTKPLFDKSKKLQGIASSAEKLGKKVGDSVRGEVVVRARNLKKI